MFVERFLAFGNDFADFQGREQGIVEAVIIFTEKEMSRDFACERRMNFFHFGFDKAVAGFAHYRLCTVFYEVVDDYLGKFYVEDDRGFCGAVLRVVFVAVQVVAGQ